MFVGAVITGLVGLAATIGGAAAGAHLASSDNKEVGAAVGAAAGLFTSGVISAIYVAVVGDTLVAQTEVKNAALHGAGVAGALPAARPASSATQRLTNVGPLIVAKR